MMRVVELFCGAGGMSLDLIKAGMTIQRAYDNSSQALDVHRFNIRKAQKRSRKIRLHELREMTVISDSGEATIIPLPSHAVYRDLADLPLIVPEIIQLRPDVITVGPPYQDFSRANQKRKEGPRAGLTVGFCDCRGFGKTAIFHYGKREGRSEIQRACQCDACFQTSWIRPHHAGARLQPLRCGYEAREVDRGGLSWRR